MSFYEFISQNWRELLVLTREHIFLVFFSTGLAILVGVPVGDLDGIARARELLA